MRCRRSQINRTGGRALWVHRPGIGDWLWCSDERRAAGWEWQFAARNMLPATSQTVRHWGPRGLAGGDQRFSAHKQPNVSGRVPLRAGRPVHEPVSERSSIRPRERLSRCRVSLEIQAAEFCEEPNTKYVRGSLGVSPTFSGSQPERRNDGTTGEAHHVLVVQRVSA